MSVNILWADDEIDLLKPHVLFLEEKGYTMHTVNNGSDAVDMVKEQDFDMVFLDENMPGINGIETLARIKAIKQHIPVIMITKSEEEHIMEDAIGSQIADYLIKPVNPKQILLALKKNLDGKRLVSEKTTSNYQQQFREIGMKLSGRLEHGEWAELYRELVHWDLALGKTEDPSMAEILRSQWNEANDLFSRYVDKNYVDWVNGRIDGPLQSHQLFKEKVLPEMEKSGSVFLVVIDNLRLDQWKMIEPIVAQYFRVETDELFYSILPTATQYARNAIFAGMMPSQIQQKFPKLWKNEDEEGSKNASEDKFLEAQLKRLGKPVKFSYNKITNINAGKRVADHMNELKDNELNVVVYNFVDMLSHARTEMEVIRELADDDAAYRSLTVSWFEHSPLLDIIKGIAEMGASLVIATDHGTVRVNEPSKVVGDRNTNTNLRYKFGKNLSYEAKDVFEVKDPESVFLPRNNVSTKYVFAKQDKYFVYPNNYNHFVNYYRHTFQHGGISMEEMIIPVITLKPR